AGGARGDGGVGAGAGVELHRDVRGRGVRHQHRHGERVDAPRAALTHDVPLVQRGPDPADAGADHHPEPLRGHLGGAGVGPGLARGDHGVLPGGVQLAGLRAAEGVERTGDELAGEVHGQPVALLPVVVEGACGGGPGQGGLPGGGDVTAERADGAEAGHGDTGTGSGHTDLRIGAADETATPGTGTSRASGGGSVLSALDVLDGVADGGEVLDLFVGDADVELLLGVDHDGHHRDGVDVEVVGEGLVELDVLGGDTGLLVHDLGEALEDLVLGVCHGCSFRCADVWRSQTTRATGS